MIRRFFKAVARFLECKCPECGKCLGSTKGCYYCEKFEADRQAYSF